LANEKTVRGRVGMLVHGYYPGDVRVRREAECLVANDFDVHVICIGDRGSGEKFFDVVNGVHIHRIPLIKKRGSTLRYCFEYFTTLLLGIWKLTLLHQKKRFDIVHVHNMPDLLVLSGLIPKLTGSVLVLDVHDPMTELFQENNHLDRSKWFTHIIKVQERICYKLADRLITVSHPMAENVAKKRGCAKEAIKVIHNFPDLELFPVREDRGQWPYHKDNIVLLYSGTITEHYRLDIAIKALVKVLTVIPNIRLQVLGQGNRLQEILSLAKDLGIGDRVEHLQPVSVEMVKTIMANVDVGISTHQSGVFGDLYFSTKIIEFMTQGLPVISSRTSTIEKYIPEDCIFYFEPGQVEDLAKLIIFMCNNPSLVLEKIRNSKKLLSKYTWQKEAPELMSFYESLMRSGKKVRRT